MAVLEKVKPETYSPSDIKWIKNVNNEVGAYFDVGEEFELHDSSKTRLKKPKEDEIILLYQKINKTICYTHLVVPIDAKVLPSGTEKHQWVRKVRTLALFQRNKVLFREDTNFGKFNFQEIGQPILKELNTVKAIENLSAFQKEIFNTIPWYEKRLFRLTWNTNQWEHPSFHPWKKEKQGDSNVAHENKYGYGHEEWLMNPINCLDGYQYGYLRGAEDINTKFIHESVLFTIEPKTGNRYIVGTIRNIEVIDEEDFQTEKRKLAKRFLKHQNEFIHDLEAVAADSSKMKKAEEFYVNIRFKLQGDELNDEIILANQLRGNQWNRFKPYYIEGDLRDVLDEISIPNRFEFKVGIASQKKKFQKTTTSKTTTITKTHSTIVKAVVEYLSNDFSKEKENISVEKTYFGGNPADIVLKHSRNLFSIIEVKTSSNARRNIREALGQLLDYALWNEEVKIKDLIIVAPTPLGVHERALFERLKNSLNLKLQYWQCNPDSSGSKEKVIKLL